MADVFPIPTPARLPIRINPCPIVEAIFEVRFTASVPWAIMPGLLFAQIRERYPKEKSLPLSQFPEQLRREEPNLANLPLIQFIGDRFLIQMGPRIVGLVTKANEYPGWPAIRDELSWLFERLERAAIVKETERLGVRFIDFFPQDLFQELLLSIQVNGQPFTGMECNIATVLRKGALTVRLNVTNGAIVETKAGPKAGSVLDVDAWFRALDVDVFQNGQERFAEAHQTIKELFFGLLKPEFLDTLNPEYE